MRRLDIPTSAVRIGMHVVNLDRPWPEVPLAFQKFVVEKTEQIRVLQAYCLSVTVDLTEAQYQQYEAARQGSVSVRQRRLPERHSLIEELPVARAHYLHAKAYINDLLAKVAASKDINFEGVHEIVQNCVKSIVANPNAIFWLSRIRHEDAYTAEHCVRVGVLAITFARFLDLPEPDMKILGLCGMLHDVGKMKISPDLLNKPGALSPEEWQVVKAHPTYGHQLLAADGGLDPLVKEAALSHHERMDGSGYPNGLSGNSIGLYARIIAIVDAYDAITSDRPYQKGRSSMDALRILYQCSGSHFDSDLVQTFITMIGLYPPGSLVQLKSGEIAVVLSTSPAQKLKPVIELVLDAAGNPCVPRVLRLTERPLNDAGEPYAIVHALPDNTDRFDLKNYIQQRASTSNKPLATDD
ncbi:MAG: HD-GYP domain-containing protein [Marinobacter sp.]|nr:HD-GYP domain-containing protein [Marinobacter sp.]